MGLTPSQTLSYSRYDYFIIYKDGKKLGFCSNREIERLERFFPNHCFEFEQITTEHWLDEFQLAKINDPNSVMPEYSPDEEKEQLPSLDEIEKIL